ncbi:MAG: cytochrome c [Thermoanaerobaculia bacterium]|nr:cytochrome c [Thermoanaerobaculia bacterium]
MRTEAKTSPRRALATIAALGVGFLLGAAGGQAQEGRPKGDPIVGESIYQGYCRSCHGDFAEGDGPVAEHLNIKPADLTKLYERWDGQFDADIAFRAISGDKKVRAHGNSEMPVWGEAFKVVEGGQTQQQVDQRLADLVAFLQSIQR